MSEDTSVVKKEQKIKEHKKDLSRQYKIKSGSNTEFECRGALMHGPDRYYFWGACTGLLYWGLVVPMLILQEIFPRWYNIVNVILFGILWLFTICMHLIVAYMDPGIIPRIPKKKIVSTGDPYLDSLATPPTTKQVVVNGKSITCKLCSTCNIYRPPRTVHCSTCDNCVMRFDHHCPYVGNCVGLRNYKYFLCFLFGVFTSCLFALAHICAFVANRVIARGWNAPVNFVFAFVVALLCIVSIALIAVLLVWTCYLVSLGRTTYEKIKFEKLLTPNPYDKGIVRNWINICCAPNYPRAYYPRRHVAIPEVEEV